MSDPVVIVGGGQAAVQLCLALRKEKYNGAIKMFSAERDYPYHRPPLSKAFITGQTEEDKLPMRPESFYEAKNIDLSLGDEVTAIDLSAKTVSSQSGVQRYSNLVLTTGAVARPLSIDGRGAAGVFELRDLADARAVRAAIEQAESIAVIGAGFIGLEVAASANKLNKQVTVFDTADRVMGRAVAPQTSQWFEQTHRNAGIDIFLGESIKEIIAENGKVCGVIRDNGDVIGAQLVLIGVGVLPSTGLADAAGLACDNGVVVDQFCRTSDEHVFAAGDCANHPNPFAKGRRLRLESIQNATDQARVIASVIAAEATGHPAESAPYHAVPWFWSDQAEHSLQMTGLSFDTDEYIVRGDPESGSFSVFHYAQNKLQAVDSVNASRDHMVARKLLSAGISPSAEQSANIDTNLMELVKAAL